MWIGKRPWVERVLSVGHLCRDVEGQDEEFQLSLSVTRGEGNKPSRTIEDRLEAIDRKDKSRGL